MALTVGITTLSKSANTLGLQIVARELRHAGFDVVEVTRDTARTVDVLFVSLFWCDQVIKYPSWLMHARINPTRLPGRSERPYLVLGGSMLFNPWPLEGMFDYAVLGDGETVAVRLVRAIEAGRDPAGMAHVIDGHNLGVRVEPNLAPRLPEHAYADPLLPDIVRIEIARGCPGGCLFCQLRAIKPYRELPTDVAIEMLRKSTARKVALFAPDRMSHSGYLVLEREVHRLHKRNIGTDTRLRAVRKKAVASQIRFGLEGFSERDRKRFGKPYTDDDVVRDILHIVHDMHTPAGKPIRTFTQYMILGAPWQTADDYRQFAQLLRRLDDGCAGLDRPLTLFLSCSDFLPACHTPLERAEKDVWTNHAQLMRAELPHLKNIVMAHRGGSRPPAKRLAQLLTYRGGPNSARALHYISTKMGPVLARGDAQAGRQILSVLKRADVDLELLIHGRSQADAPLPWACYAPVRPPKGGEPDK